MANQIILIYAASAGFLDEIPVNAIGRYETDLYAHLEGQHGALIDSLRASGEMDDEFLQKLTAVLEAFTKDFQLRCVEQDAAQD